MDGKGSESGLVARRAGLVAFGTLVSRVLGMVREAVIAANFTLAQTDAFFIAFTIPNTLRMLLAEGAVSNAFLPAFTDVRTREGEAASKLFLARFMGALTTLLLLATGAGILMAPLLGLLYAGGLSDEPERFALVVSLTRWLFPFLLLAGLSALATGALNARGKFIGSAFAPALFNVAMIVAPFALIPFAERCGLPSISVLAFGALVGGVLQLTMQLPALHGVGLLLRPRQGWSDPQVKRALKLMAPLILGLGIYQINMLLSRLFASLLPEGSQSYLNYGQRVIEIPQGMFALALSSATLPSLSRLRSEEKHEELLVLFRYSLRLTLFIAIPSSVAIFALADPIALVLFGRGAFSALQAAETARSLAFQALGVWAVAGVRAVIPMFSAHGDTRTPVRASGLNLLVFLCSTLALMGMLDHVAIAVGNSLAAAAQLGMLLWALGRRLGPLGIGEVMTSAARTSVAAVAMGICASAMARFVEWTEASELSRFSWLCAVTCSGVLIFLGVSFLLRSRELRELVQAVRHRGKRAT